MLMKMSFAILAAVATLLTLSGRAIAQPKEYLAEEVEAYNSHKTLNHNRHLFLTGEMTGVVAGGSLTVKGDMSQFQLFNRVKAIKCEPTAGASVVAKRKSCGEAVYFGLNEARSLTPGYYILGFENSIYPGFVQISAGADKVITLQKIAIPTDGVAKVYRNLNTSVEQKKMMFTQFQLGKSMFSLAAYDFGDLYLRKFPLEDLMPNVEYSFCDSGWSQEIDPQASRLCRDYKSSSFTGMSSFFVFNADSTHTEYVPRIPGDAFNYNFDRLLVSAPTVGAGNFVNVFAGEYTIETTVGSKSSHTNTSVMEKDASGRAMTSFGAE